MTEAQIRAEHAVRRAEWESQRPKGVCFGGLDGWRYAEPTDAQIEAEAKARSERIEAFRKTPRFRLLNALRGLDDCGAYDREAYAVRTIYDRSLSDERLPVNPEAVARAIRILADIPNADARAGIVALCDLMVPALQEAA